MEIDGRAAAVTSATAEVAAPRELVWAILTDVRRWPEWNRDVTRASLDGPLGEGGVLRFKFRFAPVSITSRLLAVEPQRGLEWAGALLTTRTLHAYRLDEGGATTTVTSTASWDGLLVKVLRSPLRRAMGWANASALAHLKAAAEATYANGDGSRTRNAQGQTSTHFPHSSQASSESAK